MSEGEREEYSGVLGSIKTHFPPLQSESNLLSSFPWVQTSTLQIRLRRLWAPQSSSPKTTPTPMVCTSDYVIHGSDPWLIALVIVVPAHIAFVLLNEGAGEQQPPGGLNQGSKNSLFTSVIQKVGGDPASLLSFIRVGTLRR